MDSRVWLIGTPVVLLVLASGVPSLRRAYLDGWRCVLRHGGLWKIPAGFALAYGLFAGALEMWLTNLAGRDMQPVFQFNTAPPALSPLIASSLVPAAEQLAATLTSLVSVFPLSCIAALLLLVNYRGLARELFKMARARYGAGVWIILPIALICTLSALVKPVSFLALPFVSKVLDTPSILGLGATINLLSFIFEFLLGTTIQLCLLFTAYGWVRGLSLNDERLLPFAVRRLGYVLKWSLVIVAATLVIFHLPFLWDALHSGSMSWNPESWARLFLSAMTLLFGTVQIHLAFHNTTLKQAIIANFRFLRTNGFHYLGFLLTAFGFLLIAQFVPMFGLEICEGSLVGVALAIFAQTLAAGVGGWLLASWVCFFKQYSRGGKEITY
ncbi:hypothetical protein TSACC_22551 [Terrimicrobium sacchariphilum]|uniref:Uncharacterized protein n=1 Tax=Terrimicrobium sacchariphilum TaxID=690879 RepID=A0A146GBI0_TERSA|nr:hypothetical protein [Terrimicrobium sacchariphilum]GAT34127.1 hypothetical protein TSACC_22551 [Terrimicrobium sacchariphilum]